MTASEYNSLEPIWDMEFYLFLMAILQQLGETK